MVVHTVHVGIDAEWVKARTKENIVYMFRAELKKVKATGVSGLSHNRNRQLVKDCIIKRKEPSGCMGPRYCLTEYAEAVLGDLER